jgi:hypothetical protein
MRCGFASAIVFWTASEILRRWSAVRLADAPMKSAFVTLCAYFLNSLP